MIRCVVAFAVFAIGAAQIVIVNKTLEKHSFGSDNKVTAYTAGSDGSMHKITVEHERVDDRYHSSGWGGSRENDDYREPSLSDEWRKSIAESATDDDSWTKDWSKEKQAAKGGGSGCAGPKTEDRSGCNEHAEVTIQIEQLEHAKSALEFMEERHAKRLTSDTEEVDHLIQRKHLLTDRRSETDKDVKALEKRTDELEEKSTKKAKEGKLADAKVIDAEVAEIKLAALSLRGSPGEEKEIDREIESDTADGKTQDEAVNKLSKQREAIDLQVRLLERYGEDISESAESAGGFKAQDDDPYLKEAQQAMEQASGWSSDHLDHQVNEARNVLTKGISGKASGNSAATSALRGGS